MGVLDTVGPTPVTNPRRRRLHPARLTLLGFGGGILVGTVLLMLPISTVAPGGASLIEAFFTAVSAICVTGHVIVDTATYWTPFGQTVILLLIQIGGSTSQLNSVGVPGGTSLCRVPSTIYFASMELTKARSDSIENTCR